MKFQFRSMIAATYAAVAAAVILPAQAQEIPVAALSALTGPTAFIGVPVHNGIKLAIEQANQSGFLGAAKIKLLETDYAADKAQAISLANQFIKRDKVVMVLGPTGTGDSLAVAPVLNEGKTPFLALGQSDRILETGPYAFKPGAAPSAQLPLLAKYVLDKTQVRRIAIIYDRSNDGMVEHKDLFRDTFKAAGGVVATEEGVASNESNFLPLVTKIISQNVQGVFFAIYAEQAANVMIQLRQAGLPASVRVFGNPSLPTPKMVEIAGKVAEGAIGLADYSAGQERNKAFEAAYKARFGKDPDTWAAVGYSQGLIALRAIKDAGPNPTPQKVRDALAKVRDVPVPMGNGVWTQNDKKQPSYGAVLLQVKDGKFVVVQ